MALSITPGYDFTVNEVPTNAKIQLMLTGMQINDIPKGSIDGSLSGVLYGWLTGTTMATLPDEGSILWDISGNMWVKTNTGVVNLWRSGMGGYESVRVKCGDPLEPAQNNPIGVANWYGRIESLVASNLDFDNVFYRVAANQSQTLFNIHQVTTVSGFHVRLILCGTRRATVLLNTGTWRRDTRTGNDTAAARAIEKSIAAVNEWKVTEFPNFNDSSDGLGPVFAHLGPNLATDIHAPAFMFGADIMVI